METSVVSNRVLLAEDDRFLRRACETSLRARGFTVSTAADGEEALRAARAERPDLIVLDMLMPKLSGLDVLRAVRSDARTRSVPVLVMSSSGSDEDIAAVTRLGANGCLAKGKLSLQQLSDHVVDLMGG
jgi:two-component system phosphate regulon response regulator PhoB